MQIAAHELRNRIAPPRHAAARATVATTQAWSHLRPYGAHVSVFDEGDPAGSVWEIVEGAVMLYKILPDGRRQVVELLGPGDFFGFGEGGECGCGAETLTDARILAHDRRRSDDDADFQLRLMDYLRRRVRQIHEHTVLLGRKSALERVASFLVGLGQQDVVDLALNRQEIADYLGLTIETVSRSFSALRRRGAIALERNDRVRLLDREGLEDIAGWC